MTPNKVLLVELTVPWDAANPFQTAMERKTARYERLTEDLREAGYDARNLPLEIGCRGMRPTWSTSATRWGSRASRN